MSNFDYLESVRFEGKASGVKLLILGAIHGNEVCGYKAIKEIESRIIDGRVTIQKGNLTLVPKCNVDAFAQNKRCIEKNLNRIIQHYKNPSIREEGFADRVASEIDKCDYMLDLHSMSQTGSPCMVVEYENCMQFAQAINPKYIVSGFQEVCNQNGIISQTTGHYAHSVGKISLTVECGQHQEASSVEVAFQSILDVLKHLEFINDEDYQKNSNSKKRDSSEKQLHLVMEKIQFKEKSGILAKEFKNADKILKGESIALYDDETKVIADKDCYIIMPMPKERVVNVKDDWCYISVLKP